MPCIYNTRRAIELIEIVGAFLVLEECVIGAVVDLVIVLFLNVGMELYLYVF
jgi:hypothetical protein